MTIDLEKRKKEREEKILSEMTEQEHREIEKGFEFAYKHRKKIKKIQEEIDKLGL